jgi:hypothetical protein
MVFKMIKYGALTLAAGAVAVSLVFGGEAFSYVRSSATSVRTAVKDQIPVEFQLRRARDLLNNILPEMQANVRLMAQQEVEIEAAKADLEAGQKALTDEAARILKVREAVGSGRAQFTFGGLTYTRDQLTQELARRFERYREAEATLAAKRQLLDGRQQSLAAAERQLEQMRLRKVALETQVETLAGQHRLVLAASSDGRVTIDAGKLAQAERLVAEIRQNLNVAERVLAREAKFTQAIPVDLIDEEDVMSRVARHFDASEKEKPVSVEDVPAPAPASAEKPDKAAKPASAAAAAAAAK